MTLDEIARVFGIGEKVALTGGPSIEFSNGATFDSVKYGIINGQQYYVGLHKKHEKGVGKINFLRVGTPNSYVDLKKNPEYTKVRTLEGYLGFIEIIDRVKQDSTGKDLFELAKQLTENLDQTNVHGGWERPYFDRPKKIRITLQKSNRKGSYDHISIETPDITVEIRDKTYKMDWKIRDSVSKVMQYTNKITFEPHHASYLQSMLKNYLKQNKI